ncbi:sugar 3,4-ketoisomerase [Pseudomonas capeferrum]|uniref:sugar 3,4-ketoisomerase n=1 Tax=Pseudomonas capeferrum TaxID=1495066 RepID=UPI0035C1C4EE
MLPGHVDEIRLNILGDDRGSLISIEKDLNIPFAIRRIYYIFGTRKNVSRGFHAHRDLQQLLVCVSGSCRVTLDDGANRIDHILDSPDKALLVKNMMWREMHDFSEDCVLMVAASEVYDERDYIRDYQEFRSLVDNA